MTNLKLKTVFIVEDDPGISYVLSELLKGGGFDVQVARNGLVALKLLQKCGMPSLILLDMMMPQMNGWEFAKEFAARYENRCPIIVMTAAANAQQRAIDINAVDLIEKPFDFKKFITTMNKHITA